MIFAAPSPRELPRRAAVALGLLGAAGNMWLEPEGTADLEVHRHRAGATIRG